MPGTCSHQRQICKEMLHVARKLSLALAWSGSVWLAELLPSLGHEVLHPKHVSGYMRNVQAPVTLSDWHNWNSLT